MKKLIEHPNPEYIGYTVLPMALKRKWFDMILSGAKTDEYREIKSYWITRLTRNQHHHIQEGAFIQYALNAKTAIYKHIDAIQFTNGYDSKLPSFIIQCKGIEIGYAKNEWSDGYSKPVFVIHLGDIISVNNLRPNSAVNTINKTALERFKLWSGV